jgi:hypothetical protein
MAEADPRIRRVKILFRSAAIVLALAETWAMRRAMDSDGIQYLDMGDAYWRRDWHTAINAYWSPMYSWFLGGALKVLKPSAYWEFPLVHAVNFVIFLGALASFEFLLRALIDGKRNADEGAPGLATLPEWAWWSIGYALFLWVSFDLIGLGTTTPDMCVAAFTYLAAGVVLKIRAGSTGWMTFILLGAMLGLGYWAKAIMFPLSFVFLGVALFSMGSLPKAAPRVLLAAVVFLAVASPFLIAFSTAVGHLTFGESGRLNYIWFVDQPFRNLPPGVLKHPFRGIHESPVAYEFSRPMKVTDALAYDVAYESEGLKGHFDLKGQIQVLKLTGITYYQLLFSSEAGVIAALLVLFAASPEGPRSSLLRSVREGWYLIVPAVAGLGAFLLVHVEGRFVGPYVLLLWLGILSGVVISSGGEPSKLVSGVVLAIALTMGVPVVITPVLDASGQRHKGAADWDVAQALTQMGIQQGDQVAYIRSAPYGDFAWARLARIQIIAEIPPEEVARYWAASPQVQREVMDAFALTGAKATIAGALPPGATAAAWQRLGTTDFYAHFLR